MAYVCSQCGAPLTNDSKFCSHCGAKVDDGTIRAEITINDTARIKEVELQKHEFDAKGKLVQRIENLSETFKDVSQAMAANYKKRAEARRGVLEEKARKAEAKAAGAKAKAEAKIAESKVREAKKRKFLLICLGVSFAALFILWLLSGLF